MKRLLKRYWDWYNVLPEPKRFGMAMLMMSPIIVVGFFDQFLAWPWKPVVVIGCALVPCSLILSRWWVS